MRNWTQTVERYLREGRTVSGGCGASSEQNQIAGEQASNFNTMSNEAQQVFGNSSQIFNDLNSAFAPTVAAGEGQNGMTAPEYAANKSQIITNTGNAYRNAATAAGERIAASGGGNAVLPSGTTAAVQGNIAAQGAADTANQLTGLNIRNAELGRQNWFQAASILGGAPSVFNPATSAGGAATTAGSSAMSGATAVNNANNQWVSDVTGILGDAAGIVSGLPLGGGGGGGGNNPGNNAGIVSGGVTYS